MATATATATTEKKPSATEAKQAKMDAAKKKRRGSSKPALVVHTIENSARGAAVLAAQKAKSRAAAEKKD